MKYIYSATVAEAAPYGFDTYDVGPYVSALDALAAQGFHAIVWLGGYDRDLGFDNDDDWIRSHVGPIADHAAVRLWQVCDEPNPAGWSSSDVAAVKARSDLLHALGVTAPTYTVFQAYSGKDFDYAPWVGCVDRMGFDAYPITWEHGFDEALIPGACEAIGGLGLEQWVAVIQGHQDGYYRMPKARQVHRMFRQWDAGGMTDYSVFSWRYGGVSLADRPRVLEAFAEENGVSERGEA